MKAAEESDEFFASRRVHRQLQSSLDSFGAAVGKMRLRRSRDRNDLIKFLGQLRHLPIVKVRPAHVNQLCGLFLNRSNDFGMTVSGRTHGDAGVAIEKKIAVNILDPDARGAFGDEFECRARISRVNELRVRLDYAAGLWPGQFSFDLWFL